MSTEAWWVDPGNISSFGRGRRKRHRVLSTLVDIVVLGLTLFLLILVVLHYRAVWWTYNLQSETVAKHTVERYVAHHDSEQEVQRLAALNKSGVIVVDALDYQYVSTQSKERMQATVVVSLDRPPPMSLMESLLHFETYDRYLSPYLSQVEWILVWQGADGTRPVSSIMTVYDYKYVFLYDVTLTSRFGNRVFKHFLFEVQPTFSEEPAFVITAIAERA